MSEEILTNRLEGFTPEYRDFVTSNFVTTVSQQLTQKYNLEAEASIVLENMLFFYLLLVHNKYDFIESLVTEAGLPIDMATNVVNEGLSMLPPEMLSAQEAAYIEITTNETAVMEKDRLAVINRLPLNRQIAYLFAKTNHTIGLSSANLSEEQVELGKVLLGDIILGFYRTEDTVPLLQQELGLDPKTAALLGAEVLEFLTPLSDPNWQPAIEKVTPHSQIPTKAPALETATTPLMSPSNIPTPPEAATVPSQTPSYEPSPVNVPEPVTTYRSTEPAVPRPPLSTIPSYTPPATPAPVVSAPPAPDRPRWSTDI